MAKKKEKDHTNVWEYADWLYLSGRLTAEEHLTLKKYLLEEETHLELSIMNEGC